MRSQRRKQRLRKKERQMTTVTGAPRSQRRKQRLRKKKRRMTTMRGGKTHTARNTARRTTPGSVAKRRGALIPMQVKFLPWSTTRRRGACFCSPGAMRDLRRQMKRQLLQPVRCKADCPRYGTTSYFRRTKTAFAVSTGRFKILGLISALARHVEGANRASLLLLEGAQLAP